MDPPILTNQCPMLSYGGRWSLHSRARFRALLSKKIAYNKNLVQRIRIQSRASNFYEKWCVRQSQRYKATTGVSPHCQTQIHFTGIPAKSSTFDSILASSVFRLVDSLGLAASTLRNAIATLGT